MTTNGLSDDHRWMQRALELAPRGAGRVEPNPMVGAVLVRDGTLVGEGWHQQFGGPHAEIEALQQAGPAARGATLYVTLEPCCHFGKTPPCVEAVLAAGVRRVVAAVADPFPLVAGGGLARLRAAGVEVEVGLLAQPAAELIAPFHKLVATGRPYLIAKWAMSLDGKIATRTGESQWISNETSRAWVHALRGRVDAILVGRGTVQADNPRLTARPPGPRVATRIVLDSAGELPNESQLLQTVIEAPVLVVAGPQIPAANRRRLETAGCEVFVASADAAEDRWEELLDELGRRRMTNVLVEGGSQVLGSCLARALVDEVHIFISPRIIGGEKAPGPVGGAGIERLAETVQLVELRTEMLAGDMHLWGRTAPRR